MSLHDVMYFSLALDQHFSLRTQKPEFMRTIINNVGKVVKLKVEQIMSGGSNSKDKLSFAQLCGLTRGL
jgi:hypothetical protein